MTLNQLGTKLKQHVIVLIPYLLLVLLDALVLELPLGHYLLVSVLLLFTDLYSHSFAFRSGLDKGFDMGKHAMLEMMRRTLQDSVDTDK